MESPTGSATVPVPWPQGATSLHCALIALNTDDAFLMQTHLNQDVSTLSETTYAEQFAFAPAFPTLSEHPHLPIG